MAKGKVKNYPLRLTQDEWEWLKASTLGRRMTAIRLAHTSAGLDSPTSSESVREG